MMGNRIVHNQIFDGIRAISIFLVIYFHVNYVIIKLLKGESLQNHIDSMPSILNISWQALGSEIIFFVSGYLLTMILLIEEKNHGHISVRNFYVKRAARIIPLYYVALILFSFAGRYNLTDLLTNILFVSKILDKKTLIPVGWSLELQMQFFILVPLLVILLNKTGKPVLMLLLILVSSLWIRYDLIASDPIFLSTKFPDVILGAKPSVAQQHSYYLIQYRMSGLILGMLLDYSYVQYNQKINPFFQHAVASKLLLFIGVLLVVIFGFMPIHNVNSFLYQQSGDDFYVFYMSFQRFFFIIGTSLIILKLLFNPGILKCLIGFLGNRFFKTVSNSIYPIYLFHFPFVLIAFVLVYQTVDKEDVTSVNLLQLVLVVIISTVLASAFSGVVHRFIELPLQNRIRNRFLKRS